MKFSLQALALVGVVGVYLFLGSLGISDRGNNPRDAAYNLLARGLLSGHLYLAKEPPAALAVLKDPYDPKLNADARFGPSGSRTGVHDFSYYGGRLYLYFGIAPALLFFIPAHFLSGTWLPHWTAVFFFCTLGLIFNLSLANRIRKAHFPGFPERLAAAWVPLLGFASYAPLVLARADMWEIPIACAYCFVSAAFLCVWEALGKPDSAPGWLALASAALGAAFASRPTALLALPVLAAAFSHPRVRSKARAWIAAAAPLAACGAAVAWYNFQRFGDPFQFGAKYQLAGEYESKIHAFSLGYVWTNLRLYLFQGAHWHRWFPFFTEGDYGSLSAGHGDVERVAGVLVNVPILWAAAAIPFFILRRRPDRSLALAAGSVAWAALASLGLLAFYFGTCGRYQFEFVPPLTLLAALGLMALDRLVPEGSRSAFRALWLAVLAFSSAFPVFFSVDRIVRDRTKMAASLLESRNYELADLHYSIAYAIAPKDFGARVGIARLHCVNGRQAEAELELRELINDFPDKPGIWLEYGALLEYEGRIKEAIECYRKSVALFPNDSVAAHLNYLLSVVAGSAAPPPAPAKD
jgi:tetratricopeptide (TPR) repeat protein